MQGMIGKRCLASASTSFVQWHRLSVTVKTRIMSTAKVIFTRQQQVLRTSLRVWAKFRCPHCARNALQARGVPLTTSRALRAKLKCFVGWVIRSLDVRRSRQSLAPVQIKCMNVIASGLRGVWKVWRIYVTESHDDLAGNFRAKGRQSFQSTAHFSRTNLGSFNRRLLGKVLTIWRVMIALNLHARRTNAEGGVISYLRRLASLCFLYLAHELRSKHLQRHRVEGLFFSRMSENIVGALHEWSREVSGAV